MRIPQLTSYLRHQRGAVFLLFATAFLPLLILGSILAVDLSTVYIQKAQLQNAADAAALAAANQMTTADVNSTSAQLIMDNYITYFAIQNQGGFSHTSKGNTYVYVDTFTSNNTAETPESTASKQSPSTTSSINMMAHFYNNTVKGTRTVRVELNRSVPLYFFASTLGKFFPGFKSMPIHARATARYTPGSSEGGGAAFFGGSTSDDSIRAWSPNISIQGDVRTNGRIMLYESAANSNITLSDGNTIGNTQTQAAGQTVWSSKNWAGIDNAFGGTYNVYYKDAIDINYATSSNTSISAMGSYINTILNTSNSMYANYNYYTQTTDKTTVVCWWASDGNWYPKTQNNVTILGTVTNNGYTVNAPNPTISTGPQIYYTGSSYLTVNLNSASTNNVVYNNDGINKVMWTTGANYYGYNVVIASGTINATANVSNTKDNPMVLVSLTGDINLQNNGQSFYGMVYAPNGTIKFDGSGSAFYGSAIGNKILLSTAGQTFIHQSFNDTGDDADSKKVFSTFSSFSDSVDSNSSSSSLNAGIYLIPDENYKDI